MSELAIRQIECPRKYLDTLLLIANALKAEQASPNYKFFPVGLKDPPISEDFALRRKLTNAFSFLGIRFVWDYQANVLWVHKTVKTQMADAERIGLNND